LRTAEREDEVEAARELEEEEEYDRLQAQVSATTAANDADARRRRELAQADAAQKAEGAKGRADRNTTRNEKKTPGLFVTAALTLACCVDFALLYLSSARGRCVWQYVKHIGDPSGADCSREATYIPASNCPSPMCWHDASRGRTGLRHLEYSSAAIEGVPSLCASNWRDTVFE
jgi:hypothetical protein